ILDVTPRISRNGYVTIDVIQEANEFQGFTAFNAPLVSRRSTQTTVTVRDGQTVVIGGLMKDSETTTFSKVPVLGSLPIIGSLFRSKDKTKAKTELMVFLTPRVVRTAEESYALTQEQRDLLQMRDKVKLSPPPAVEQVIPGVPQAPEVPNQGGPADQGTEQGNNAPAKAPGGTLPRVSSS
ncbi:MAG: type II secretion system protein GspD, partial [Armatimonadota bacterium]